MLTIKLQQITDRLNAYGITTSIINTIDCEDDVKFIIADVIITNIKIIYNAAYIGIGSFDVMDVLLGRPVEVDFCVAVDGNIKNDYIVFTY